VCNHGPVVSVMAVCGFHIFLLSIFRIFVSIVTYTAVERSVCVDSGLMWLRIGTGGELL
jgi:hypothetical protein